MSFDPFGPLPSGTTVLEASAGTGKTWTIATLATRYVAEGVAELSQLLLATFSRAATQELRERVRDRLVTTARGLADPACGDALVALLRARPDAEQCRLRLVRALSEFDAATIATTHSFCSQVLDSLGTAGEAEPGAVVVESVDDLLREVVDDLYLRRWAGSDDAAPALTPDRALTIARAAVGDRAARLEPADADRSTEAGQRLGLATAARVELQRRKRQRGLRDYDDLLELLRDVLADPVRGPQACTRLRERYRVVLVDEFQDTDPVQWEVLRTAFHGAVDLVLIGDPKQAIYAFRGAEVLSYLAAREVADRVETLSSSWRSDPGLVTALDHLLGGAALGDRRIVVRPVRAEQPAPRLPGATPLTVRVVDRAGLPVGKGGLPGVGVLRPVVAADVADEVVRLLDRGLQLSVDEPRALRPGDVAVLVRTHAQASLVAGALDAAGVPSVVAASTSVFATPGARDWLWLLQALEQPHRPQRVRLAALTPLVGETAAGLDAGGDAALERVGDLLRELVRRFEEAGLAAAVELLVRRTGLQARLLAQVGGERRLTDLRHVGQLLQRAADEESLGLSALVGWLDERVADPQAASGAERSRRLDSDAAAVQVVTVHGSKGLEFPVVLVPFGWDSWRNSKPETLQLHDAGGTRLLDVGGSTGEGWKERRTQADLEDDGEELRLLYVALTRAQCAVTAWWAPSPGTRGSALHRLLLGRTTGEAECRAVPVPEQEAAVARLRAWGWPDEVDVQEAGPAQGLRWTPPADATPELAAADFTRPLDRDWRRTSYTALTAAAHDAVPGSGSEPEVPERADEPLEPAPVVAPATAGIPSTLDAFPGGAAFGSLVHEVLEVVDGSTGDLPAELRRACEDAVGRRLLGLDAGALADGLLPVLRTPLAGGGPPLADLAPGDRLAELDFELPLSGGDSPATTAATLAGLAGLLREHLPADDPLAGYADELALLDPPPLRGYLTGSIDLVLRLAGPRYVVVDHKTNRLGRGPLTTADYTRAAMAQEMRRAHYPLQALLYAVALHRFLRWRQPGYDPARHLGGVQYLFLRGMVGPQTPPGVGVFDWDLPPALVVAASDLLAGT